jgi:hypothetical protein
MLKYQRVKLSKAKIGKFMRYKKLSRVIFGKINSKIQTLTLGNYLFIIQLLKTQLLKTI